MSRADSGAWPLGEPDASDATRNAPVVSARRATDAPTVDVRSGGAVLVDDAAYADITGYLAVPPASYTLDLTLADIADRFHYLKTGLAFILTFIGVKMLLPLFVEAYLWAGGEGSGSVLEHHAKLFIEGEYKDEVINISLGVVVTAIALSIILSLIFPTKKEDTLAPDAAQEILESEADGKSQ